MEATGEGQRTRVGLAATIVVVLALAAGVGGYFVGSSGGKDLGVARAAGQKGGAERGAAKGAQQGYSRGLADGQKAGRAQTYKRAYKAAYDRALKQAQPGA